MCPPRGRPLVTRPRENIETGSALTPNRRSDYKNIGLGIRSGTRQVRTDHIVREQYNDEGYHLVLVDMPPARGYGQISVMTRVIVSGIYVAIYYTQA